ncbi:MAG: hypothetical protein JXQ75_14715 [Phycisphaerae bacterium]|nr:hypothetical protein [Phycisphaerae bacterium]
MSQLQNDEPVLHDRLGRQSMVTRVSDEVAKCSPPCVFGIHGEWGSGKTSFLHQLHWDLIGDCPQQTKEESEAAKKRRGKHGRYQDSVTVVWFEAWRYQHEKDPVIALLHEIRTQLPLYSKWLTEGKKLTEVAIRAALLAMEDMTKRIGIAPSKIQESGEQWERDHLAVALPSHTIRQHLNAALDQLLGKKKATKREHARLVVLIDDLDRCEPAAAFRLLEGIKIYLNLPSCVFVLGMNQRIIERAIAKHTAPDESPDVRHEYACEYLDKLCTNIWHLPLIDDPVDPLGQWLPEDLPHRDQFLGIVREHGCLAANARKIKSFANVLVRFVNQRKGRQLTPIVPARRAKVLSRRARLTVLMACLYHDHHELYRMIEADAEFYNLMHQWVTGLVHVDRAKNAPHALLCRLKLPTGFKQAGGESAELKEGAPSPQGEATFPDPVRGNVFRLQSLIRALGKVEVSELRDYLMSGKTREEEDENTSR